MDREMEVRLWTEAVVCKEMVEGISKEETLGEDKLHDALKDGIFICKLANRVTNSKIKPGTMNSMFTHTENIQLAIDAFRTYGIPKGDLFEVKDLYENKNMGQVMKALYTVGKKAEASGFDGPVIGQQECGTNEKVEPETKPETVEPVSDGEANDTPVVAEESADSEQNKENTCQVQETTGEQSENVEEVDTAEQATKEEKVNEPAVVAAAEETTDPADGTQK